MALIGDPTVESCARPYRAAARPFVRRCGDRDSTECDDGIRLGTRAPSPSATTPTRAGPPSVATAITTSPDDSRRRRFLTVESVPTRPRHESDSTMTLLQTAPEPSRHHRRRGIRPRRHQDLRHRRHRGPRPRRRRHRLRRRPVHRHHGPVRLGQVDPHALHGRPRSPRPPARSPSATSTSPPPARSSSPCLRRDRLGFIFQAFNLVPTLTAIENITLPMDLAGTKPDRDWVDHVIDDRRAVQPPASTGRTSCRAASNSASPSPGRWPAGRRSSSPTSRPATSTAPPAPRSSRSCATPCASSARRSSWSPTTRSPPATRTAWSSSPTVASPTSWPIPTPDAVLDHMRRLSN